MQQKEKFLRIYELKTNKKRKIGKLTKIGFVGFENILQSTICINTLQGYRFDKKDLTII